MHVPKRVAELRDVAERGALHAATVLATFPEITILNFINLKFVEAINEET